MEDTRKLRGIDERFAHRDRPSKFVRLAAAITRVGNAEIVRTATTSDAEADTIMRRFGVNLSAYAPQSWILSNGAIKWCSPEICECDCDFTAANLPEGHYWLISSWPS